MSPSVHSCAAMMGLGQELSPSPIILPVDGGMALQSFVATNKPLPHREFAKLPLWSPLGKRRLRGIPGGRGARRPAPAATSLAFNFGSRQRSGAFGTAHGVFRPLCHYTCAPWQPFRKPATRIGACHACPQSQHRGLGARVVPPRSRQGAHGVVVAHPLHTREALDSISNVPNTGMGGV